MRSAGVEQGGRGELQGLQPGGQGNEPGRTEAKAVTVEKGPEESKKQEAGAEEGAARRGGI